MLAVAVGINPWTPVLSIYTHTHGEVNHSPGFKHCSYTDDYQIHMPPLNSKPKNPIASSLLHCYVTGSPKLHKPQTELLTFSPKTAPLEVFLSQSTVTPSFSCSGHKPWYHPSFSHPISNPSIRTVSCHWYTAKIQPLTHLQSHLIQATKISNQKYPMVFASILFSIPALV